MKTNELIGPALDWAVAKCEGLEPVMRHDYMKAKAVKNNYTGDLEWHLKHNPNEPIYLIGEATQPIPKFSADWSKAGPIIERERISIVDVDGYDFWKADKLDKHANPIIQYGPTPLIAAMRCYVASRLGNEVEIPEELQP